MIEAGATGEILLLTDLSDSCTDAERGEEHGGGVAGVTVGGGGSSQSNFFDEPPF